jgi:uncharacterized membrane protein YhiD involved in acid resistance
VGIIGNIQPCVSAGFWFTLLAGLDTHILISLHVTAALGLPCGLENAWIRLVIISIIYRKVIIIGRLEKYPEEFFEDSE